MNKTGLMIAGLALAACLHAADYRIDTKGAHASIHFKATHLGYSMLLGRFNDFSGSFSYDPENLEASTVSVKVDTTSLDSNHAERDKHLKSDDYVSADKYPVATFESTGVEDLGDGRFKLMGNLTLHGNTQPIVIDARKIGEGKDPWGGYRAGFAGTTTLVLEDFGIPGIGPTKEVEMELHIEGIRQ